MKCEKCSQAYARGCKRNDGGRMTVTEYREKHPHCYYCLHKFGYEGMICGATGKTIRKRTAKKCPCYVPMKWSSDKFAKETTENNVCDLV